MTDGDTLSDENDGGTDPDNQLLSLGIGQYRKQGWWQSWNSTIDPVFSGVRLHMQSAGRRVFGDKHGLALFCAALAFFALYWRIGVMINDSYTIANGLVAVSEGQLHVDRAVYGPSLETPGMVEINGRAYARNYGQITLALPFLWVIQGIDVVADLRVAIAGGWAILVLGLSMLVGSLLDRDVLGLDSRILAGYIGSIVALGYFVVVLSGATGIDPVWHHLMALQAQTMVAAAFVGVVIYRLLQRMYNRHIGLAAGAVVAFASPIGFWAIFPKRHVLVSLGVVTSVYCLYRSREAIETQSSSSSMHLNTGGQNIVLSEMTFWRSLAYIPVGLVAWVNPLEGLILLAALLAVDIPTGGRRIRSLVAAGCTCILSVIPMFITNTLISGNPFEPPTAHDRYGKGGLGGQGGTSGGASTGGVDGGTTSSTALDSFIGMLTVAGNYLDRGFSVVTSEIDTLLYVFVRSGYARNIYNGGDALRLSVVEVMPLAAAMSVLPIVFWRINIRQRLREIVHSRQISPIRTVDITVVVYALLVSLMFLPSLPMPAELTVRYLLVLFPLSVYGLARLSSIQRVIISQYRVCISGYMFGVFVVGQFLFLYLYAADMRIEEAFKLHGNIGLVIGVLVAGWIITDELGYQNDRVGGIILGLAGAVSTVFILVFVLWYFSGIGSLALF